MAVKTTKTTAEEQEKETMQVQRQFEPKIARALESIPTEKLAEFLKVEEKQALSLPNGLK